MRLLHFKALCFLSVILIFGCEYDPQVDPWWVFAPHSNQMIPTRVLANHLLPVAVRVPENIRFDVSYEFLIESSPALIATTGLVVKRGRGAALTTTGSAGEITVSGTCGYNVVGFDATVQVLDNPPIRELSGTLSGDDLVWDSTSTILVVSNIQIPTGSSLTILPGTIITLASQAEIQVEGDITCNGSDAPVLFLPETPDQPWGEIDHRPGSTARYENVFFVGGGGNQTRAFGHSSSQPILGGEECCIIAENIVIMDCPGKAFGLLNSIADIRNSLITRCDTGGEFRASLTMITDSYFLDIPDADHVIDDDDNDGMYLAAPWSVGSNASRIERCVIMTCEDDGVDHDGVNLVVDGCVIDDMFHEGVAASGDNTAEVINTLVTNCEQGIEAGWGHPQVTVNHCTLIKNKIGLRLGDSYDWGSYGSILFTNSIIVDSDSLNVWNYDLLIEGPREDVITITYSIVNQSEYDSCTGCLTGIPVFGEDFTLYNQSIGHAAASDQLNMGLLPF